MGLIPAAAPPPSEEEIEDAILAGLLVRMAAAFYDGLILLALFFMATFVLLFATGGHALAPNNPFYELYLLVIAFLYFGYSWIYGGQTIGMRAFRLRIVDANLEPLRWWQAGARFSGGCLAWASLGVGFLWMVFEREGRTWPDLCSRTITRRLVKRPRAG
jgi:uncharacterized RDD family membrane protein YckC